MQKVLSYTLHKPRRLHYPTKPVMVFSTHQQWAIDLMEVGQLAKWNNKTRYLLIVINVLLKFAWVVPLRNKFSEEVTKVFSKLLKQS